MEKPFEISCSLDYPGGVRLLCQLPGEDGKALDVTNPATGAKNAKSVGIGAMVAPEQLRPAVPCPDDFDEFWNRQRRLLEAVPIRADRREIKLPSGLSGYADKVKAYDVKVDCAGSMPVSGRLAMPADAPPRSAPAYVSFHGAGVYSAGIRADLAAMGAIAFDVNAHGIDNGLSSEAYRKLAAGELKGYMGRNADDPEKYYYGIEKTEDAIAFNESNGLTRLSNTLASVLGVLKFNEYKELIPKLVKHQINQGGNILMFQHPKQYRLCPYQIPESFVLFPRNRTKSSDTCCLVLLHL